MGQDASPQPSTASVASAPPGTDEQKERLEIFKLVVEMADRVSQRRQAANSFYLSIDTLLVSGSAYIGTTGPSLKTALIITAAGVGTSLLWLRGIESYKTLNNAKFNVIHDIEKRLCENPFTAEWSEIDPTQHGKRHRPFYSTERSIPYLFMVIFILEGISTAPWHYVPTAIGSIARMLACR